MVSSPLYDHQPHPERSTPYEPGAVEAGTVPEARSAGFLWVISSLLTLRSPLVTSSPRFNSANTAAGPPAAAAAGAGGRPPGGGGGGGGGGAPPAAARVADPPLNWDASPPWDRLNSGTNQKYRLAHLGIPSQASGMMIGHVLLQFIKQCQEAARPVGLFRVPII
jgi:hypothetical protein